MPRHQDSQLDALIVNSATETLVDIRLRGAAEPLRFSTLRKLTVERGVYEPLVAATGPLRQFEEFERNQIKIELHNIDTIWGAKIASNLHPLDFADVSVRRYYQHPDDALVYRDEPFFAGKLVAPEGNELTVSFDVIPKTTAAGQSIATKTLAPYDGFKVPGTISQSPPGSPGNPTSGGGSVGGIDGGCFIAGTPVLTPRGWQPIERIKKGWRVYSFDERTREMMIDTVVRTFRYFVTRFYRLGFADGGRLNVTPEHRFLLAASNQWCPAFNLRYGERGDEIWRLVNRRWTKSRLTSVCLPRVAGCVEVFNMHILRNHTYLPDGYAAHNTKRPPSETPQYLPL